tara:strand:- start:92 stop:619 length:528 start_codon:yes stop_codon:yes gene_type:complete
VPLASVLAALADIPACPNWMHRCQTARVLETGSRQERVVHQVTDLPFPVKSRDLVFRVTLESDGPAVVIRLEALPDHIPEERGTVRIRKSHGHYRLEETAGGTRITWQQFVDPAGRMPAFLARGMMTDVPIKSLRSLSSWARESRYAGFRLLRDADGRVLELLPPSGEGIPASEV